YVYTLSLHDALPISYSFIEEAFPETQNYADKILVGYTDLYFYLTDMLDPFINKEQLQTWGISKPAGMVLYGPPGSGKIYWAKKIDRKSTRLNSSHVK